MNPVVIVESGGFPITNTPGGYPMTPVEDFGYPVTLVDAGGYPVALVNEDLTPWDPEE